MPPHQQPIDEPTTEPPHRTAQLEADPELKHPEMEALQLDQQNDPPDPVLRGFEHYTDVWRTVDGSLPIVEISEQTRLDLEQINRQFSVFGNYGALEIERLHHQQLEAFSHQLQAIAERGASAKEFLIAVRAFRRSLGLGLGVGTPRPIASQKKKWIDKVALSMPENEVTFVTHRPIAKAIGRQLPLVRVLGAVERLDDWLDKVIWGNGTKQS